MFKKFNTGQDYIHFFNLIKWKKVEKLFSYDNFYRKLSYDLRNNFSMIGFSAILVGAAFSFIGFLFTRINPDNYIVMYFGAIPIVVGIIILTLKKLMNTLQIICTLPFKAKFKRHMTEENLKDFVRVFSTDKYSTPRMTEKSYYNSLVLACHHKKKDFVDIGLSILNNYHQNANEKIKADYDKDVLARFSQEKIIPQAVSQEEKFMFMKE